MCQVRPEIMRDSFPIWGNCVSPCMNPAVSILTRESDFRELSVDGPNSQGKCILDAPQHIHGRRQGRTCFLNTQCLSDNNCLAAPTKHIPVSESAGTYQMVRTQSPQMLCF